MYVNIELEKIMKCFADPEKIRFVACVDRDVSDILPYLNAVVKGAIYNKNAPSLTIIREGRLITIHPRKIAAGKIIDEKDAYKVIDWLKEIINYCYGHMDEIIPDFEMHRKLTALDIYKLLPRTNCRKCGEPSCMAFAVKLARGDLLLNQCKEIFLNEFKERRKALTKILESTGCELSLEDVS